MTHPRTCPRRQTHTHLARCGRLGTTRPRTCPHWQTCSGLCRASSLGATAPRTHPRCVCTHLRQYRDYLRCVCTHLRLCRGQEVRQPCHVHQPCALLKWNVHVHAAASTQAQAWAKDLGFLSGFMVSSCKSGFKCGPKSDWLTWWLTNAAMSLPIK